MDGAELEREHQGRRKGWVTQGFRVCCKDSDPSLGILKDLLCGEESVGRQEKQEGSYCSDLG